MFIEVFVDYEVTESDIPYCHQLSEMEIEFGEECKEATADTMEEGTRDLVLEKFLSQIWISVNVSQQREFITRKY